MSGRSPAHPPQAPARTSLAGAAWMESLYDDWRRDPGSVPEPWRWFFQGFELAGRAPEPPASPAAGDGRVSRLVEAWRGLGHWIADTDPLSAPRPVPPALALPAFGLSEDDLDLVFDSGGFAGLPRAPLRDLLAALRETYCGPVGVELLHLQDPAARRWLQETLEEGRGRTGLTPEERIGILDQLTDAEVFERSLAARYPGQKRFSLEGAEALIPAIHAVVEAAPALGIEEIVLGMAHRGRLNVLANILDKPHGDIFSEFEDVAAEGGAGGTGDVKYHKGYSADHADRQGRTVHLSLTANPSHLEAADPVVLGRARGKQRQRGAAGARWRVLPFLIHGDAAFAGQGMVAEVFNLSRLEGYRVGGTLHLVVNNQIGFTTRPAEGRSTPYPTDVAKGFEAPIFHVNGEDPEALVRVLRLALAWRRRFARDVVVDMVCYRRHGHNEGDEPAFTQPLLYRALRGRPTVREVVAARLAEAGILDPGEVARRDTEVLRRLEEARAAPPATAAPIPVDAPGSRKLWTGLDAPWSFEPAATSAPRELLEEVAGGLTRVPAGFVLNPKISRTLEPLRDAVRSGGPVTWSQAELLAFGSLLLEGNPVRLSGQDSGRGTFSQRHAVWRDAATQRIHVPLRNLREGQASFCVYNSALSEASVLGFDYGYSLVEPRMLVLWEAQFGDFANGAQVIIDQFITSARAKWGRSSGLVMLLPHGFEGQGPEHSNAYLERYLQACAGDNLQVCHPTTPAQYFHLLRRQLRRPFRRPLVVMTPKGLLRHPVAVSPASLLAEGTFREVLGDTEVPAGARRVVLCSGRVWYDLVEARGARRDVALVRVEQLHPLHGEALAEVLAAHPAAEELVWAQEEPANRGAWTFMAPRLRELLPGRTLRYAGRPASASPATGSLRLHRETQAALVREALGTGPEERA